ncbi:hypothetical protein WMY93_020985 [Mugilogobius chulae]|uniref:Uncharacterized protein n=1 Tax=Mugilogobius chulae TaxID=88201 RepID=A0AAW0NCL5_9GOBI
MDSAKLQKSVCATTRNGPTHGALPRLQSPLGVEKSWQVNKNDTKPSPDIEKTLKTKPTKMEQPVKVQERPESSTSDQDSKFLQLKRSVLFHPRREFTHSMLLRLRDLEKASTCSEWKDSWKMVKHRIRTSQRQRLVQLKPFEEIDKKNGRTLGNVSIRPLVKIQKCGSRIGPPLPKSESIEQESITILLQ